jgi:hypothetical protein
MTRKKQTNYPFNFSTWRIIENITFVEQERKGQELLFYLISSEIPTLYC